MLKRCWDICHFHLGIFIQVNQDSQQGSCFLDYVLCREPFVQVGLVNHAMLWRIDNVATFMVKIIFKSLSLNVSTFDEVMNIFQHKQHAYTDWILVQLQTKNLRTIFIQCNYQLSFCWQLRLQARQIQHLISSKALGCCGLLPSNLDYAWWFDFVRLSNENKVRPTTYATII